MGEISPLFVTEFNRCRGGVNSRMQTQCVFLWRTEHEICVMFDKNLPSPKERERKRFCEEGRQKRGVATRFSQEVEAGWRPHLLHTFLSFSNKLGQMASPFAPRYLSRNAVHP